MLSKFSERIKVVFAIIVGSIAGLVIFYYSHKPTTRYSLDEVKKMGFDSQAQSEQFWTGHDKFRHDLVQLTFLDTEDYSFLKNQLHSGRKSSLILLFEITRDFKHDRLVKLANVISNSNLPSSFTLVLTGVFRFWKVRDNSEIKSILANSKSQTVTSALKSSCT